MRRERPNRAKLPCRNSEASKFSRRTTKLSRSEFFTKSSNPLEEPPSFQGASSSSNPQVNQVMKSSSTSQEQALIALESSTTLGWGGKFKRRKIQVKSPTRRPKTTDFPSSSEASHECEESTSCQIADSFINLKPRSRQNPKEPSNQNANLFINFKTKDNHHVTLLMTQIRSRTSLHGPWRTFVPKPSTT